MDVGSEPTRKDGRRAEQLRRLKIESSFLRHAEGSASIHTGHTWVICAGTVADRQPAFLRGTSRGWVTAEYGMLPRSVENRMQRGRFSGRSEEIQRLVGRSLRTVTDLDGIPMHTLTIDCDVIEADGGTRAAAITGGFVALCQACRWMVREGRIRRVPIRDQVAAISLGLVGGRLLCDLTHEEDAAASVDMNLIMTAQGRFVGIHGSAEIEPFTGEELRKMLALAKRALKRVFAAQKRALGLDPREPFDALALTRD